MKYLVIGKNGQLGKEFVKHFANTDCNYLAVGHEELELSDLSNVLQIMENYKPEVVINCSAYNLVDLAETNYETAYKSNAIGPYNLKIAQNKYGFDLIHYSTDYVFDGKKKPEPYLETDLTNPLSQYAKSKYLGEVLISDNLAKTLIFRVSWVFGEGQQNFIYKFLQFCKNEVVRTSEDEFSVPTHTKVIVDVSLKALKNNLTGLFHLCNTGFCSRYEYSLKIAEYLNLNKKIEPVSMDIFKLPAQRPRFSPMSNEKLSKVLDENIPHWTESLKEYLETANF